MTVASGVRPYNYERFPFIVQENERVGVSGILLEEPMFVTLAERDIYKEQSGVDRHFFKYFGNDINLPSGYDAKVNIEPRPDGGNLDGSWQHPVTEQSGNPFALLPGLVNVKDYILDLRTSITDLWDLIAQYDSDFDAEELRVDYFSGLFNGERYPNGLNANSELEQPVWDGREDTADWTYLEDELGSSGSLFDMDLREAQYQPFIRLSKYQENSYWPTPIWPSVCSRNGQLPRLSANDPVAGLPDGPEYLEGINTSGYQAVNTSRFLIIGDVFVPGNSKAYLYDMEDGTRASANTASCTSTAFRSINKPMDAGIGYFQHGNYNISNGLYRIGVFQGSPTNKLIPSGFSSFWPKQSAEISGALNGKFWYEDKTEPGRFVRESGIHVFSDGFWGTDGNGQVLHSPINGASVWMRGADPSIINGTYFSFSWPAQYFHEDTFYSFSVNVVGSFPSYSETCEVFTWNIDGGSPSVSTSQTYVRSDPISATQITDLSKHAPFSGVSLSNYVILQGHEASDGVSRFPIWDGNSVRGAVSTDGFGIAQNSPGFCGTCDGEIFANSPSVGDSHPRYFMQQNFKQIRETFPLPPASGSALATETQATGPYYIVYGTGVQDDFEQMNDSNYDHAGYVRFIQPEGELNTGDGSALMAFNAKLKGGASMLPFIGRIIPATSGAEKQLQIIEYWPSNSSNFLRCGNFT